MSSQRVSTTALTLVSIFSLTGCALGVMVDSDSGLGACEGKGDVAISTTQNAAGDSFTIDYYGPEAVTLGVVQGFYSENNFYNLTPTKLTGIGSDDNDPSVNLSVIGAGPGWTATPTVAGIHARYEGSITDFIELLDVPVGDNFEGNEDTFNTVMPFAVGVSCDETLVSGVYTIPLDYDFENMNIDFGVTSDFEFAAAQPVFPNHVAIDAVEILTQDPITDGIGGTLKMPSGVSGQLGDFTLDSSDEYAISGNMVLDPADIPNNNMSDLWFQLVREAEIGNTYLNITAPYSLTEPMAYTLTNTVDQAIPEGDFLLFIGVTGFNSDDEPVQKLLFGSATYSTVDGLSVSTIDVPLSGDVEVPAGLAELPNTGLGIDSILLGAFGLMVSGLGIAAFVLHRRQI